MLKRIKHISIFTIAAFYMLQFTPLFSDILIENIRDIRNKVQISKLHLAETKELPISFWNTLIEKKEFQLNGAYYDVISYKEKGDKIVAKVVKDSYEANFKIVLDNLFSKKNQSHKDKKKSQKLNQQIITLSSDQDYDLYTSKFYRYSNYRKLKGKTKKIVVITLRPPCQLFS